MTEQTNQTEQLKTEFLQKKTDYLAKEKQLNALDAEKTKAESMKCALELELDEIIAKTKEALSASKILTADEYAELKTADFNVKAKIEYYQAVSEELEEKIYILKESLHDERNKVLLARRLLCSEIFKEKFKLFSEEQQGAINELFSFIRYSDLKSNPYETRSSEELAINAFKSHLVKLINTDEELPNEFYFKNLTPNFEPKTPMRRHRERVEKEQGIIKSKGFEKLINSLIK